MQALPSDPSTDTTTAPPPPQRLSIRFTASGSEYFRLWIVNLLLTAVTLGLYLPFAKARKLRYFHENTLVGDAPLAFHGDPWRMLRGYLVMGGATLVYLLVSHLSPLAGAVLLVALAPAWPWLMRSALRFRLGQTSWRGLRLRFEGSTPDAYRVFWPIALPLAGTLITQALVAPRTSPDEAAPFTSPSPTVALLFGLCTLVLLAMGPWMHARLKHYQHDHYALADERTRLEGVRAGAFYGIQFKMFGLSLLWVIGIGLLAVLAMFIHPVVAMVVGLIVYPAMLAHLTAYVQSRLQDLVWGHTRSDHLVFESHLTGQPLTRLMLKNGLLTVVTLGLYWPFAAVATSRMRLEAVSITATRPIESLVGEAVGAAPGVTGEAAGDLLGFDVAL
jgi:uncharacterized membrane protein YjgN (DUF898 family)